jgi:hypothetical protein
MTTDLTPQTVEAAIAGGWIGLRVTVPRSWDQKFAVVVPCEKRDGQRKSCVARAVARQGIRQAHRRLSGAASPPVAPNVFLVKSRSAKQNPQYQIPVLICHLESLVIYEVLSFGSCLRDEFGDDFSRRYLHGF